MPTGTFGGKCNKAMVASIRSCSRQNRNAPLIGLCGTPVKTDEAVAQGPDRAALPVHRFNACESAARELGCVASSIREGIPDGLQAALSARWGRRNKLQAKTAMAA
jgi:hypothetical protein